MRFLSILRAAWYLARHAETLSREAGRTIAGIPSEILAGAAEGTQVYDRILPMIGGYYPRLQLFIGRGDNTEETPGYRLAFTVKRCPVVTVTALGRKINVAANWRICRKE